MNAPVTPVRKPHERTPLLVCVALVFHALCGCSASEPPSGGLIVVIDSELAIPKDIDRVRLQIVQDGQVKQQRDIALGPDALLIPGEVRVASLGHDEPVEIRGVAYQRDRARIERHVISSIPSSREARLHMPFNFLCDGTVAEDGSSTCPRGRTCKQGSCQPATLTPGELEFDPQPAQTTTRAGVTGAGGDARAGTMPGPGSTGSMGTCYDVLACFAQSAVVEFSVETCSFAVGSAIDPARLNLALALPPNRDGICDSHGCFVVLDPQGDGWTLDDGTIRLPERVCRELPAYGPRIVSLSSSCARKPSGMAVCGAWSSATQAETVEPPALSASDIGNACDGRPTRGCGDCGNETRSCREGTWSAWSGDCSGEGVCRPGDARACEEGKTQYCSAACAWDRCGGDKPALPPPPPAGNDGEGEPGPSTPPDPSDGPPGDSGDIPSGCSGESERPCGECGVQRRECDPVTGDFSPWGACKDDRDCPGSEPDVPEPIECEGESSEACGHCGTRTRSCDTTLGEFSEWSECADEGECEPGDTQTCGNGGVQRCAEDCSWGMACTMQACREPLRTSCGRCGTQVRVCNTDTGMVGPWSACLGQGPCMPGTMQQCGADKTQYCESSCQWGQCKCAPGLEDCGSGCKSLREDRNNCGACGRACINRQICRAGGCMCPLNNPGPNCTAM